jgi:transcriptional regulator with XRE-family HTH domain
MTAHTGRRLADLVNALLRRERLRIIDVMRASGLARNTIESIRDGSTKQPEPETLSQLAKGLATDPFTGELDDQKMQKLERLLSVAAGYADPTAAEARSLIELGVYYRLRSLARARAYTEMVEQEAGAQDGDGDEQR